MLRQTLLSLEPNDSLDAFDFEILICDGKGIGRRTALNLIAHHSLAGPSAHVILKVTHGEAAASR